MECLKKTSEGEVNCVFEGGEWTVPCLCGLLVEEIVSSGGVFKAKAAAVGCTAPNTRASRSRGVTAAAAAAAVKQRGVHQLHV